MATQNLSVQAKLGETDYITQITSNEFQLTADEPIDIGGSGIAPAPMQYLMSALASCVSITLKMYIQRKEWDLGEIFVIINETENEEGETVLVKTISFEKEPNEDQQKRLINIAGKCPIAKLLKSGVEQETKLV